MEKRFGRRGVYRVRRNVGWLPDTGRPAVGSEWSEGDGRAADLIPAA